MEPLNLISVIAVFVLAFAVMVGGIVSLVRVFSRPREEKARAGEEREVERLARDLALVETARTEAELANRAKSDFLAVISHELRTPLNAILGFAAIIEDRIYDSTEGGPTAAERYTDSARNIREGGEHMLSIVNNILDLSKVEAGGMELNEETFDPVAVVNAAVNLIRGRAETLVIIFLPVISLVSSNDEKAITAGIEAGADDVVVKPLSVNIINSRIGGLLKRKMQYVVTPEYIGPARHPDERTGALKVRLIDVPNIMRA